MTLDVDTLSDSEQQVLLDALIAKKLKPGKKRKRVKVIQFFTKEQTEAFFEAIQECFKSTGKAVHVRNYAIFRLIYHRGLRASEAGMIQLKDLNTDRWLLTFDRLKGSYGHSNARLYPIEVQALRAWLKIRGTAPGPLFPSNKGGAIAQQTLDMWCKIYGKVARLPDNLRHTHTLKHCCATHMLNMGIAMEDVRHHLGHAQISSTDKYAKLTGEREFQTSTALQNWGLKRKR